MPGAKKKPTKIHQLHGNPGHRPLPKNEPQPDISEDIPNPPHKLVNRYAKKEWKKSIPVLYKLGLVTKVDVGNLATYCDAYGNYVEATNDIRKRGMYIFTKMGRMVVNPSVVLQEKFHRQMLKTAVEFGMTPASRPKLSIDTGTRKVNDEESLDSFKKRR